MNKYLVKIAEIQKESSFLVGMGLTHLGQNPSTRVGLRSPKFGQSVADSFRQGMDGVHDGSLKARAASALRSVAAPDLEIIKHKAGELGKAVGPRVKELPVRAQAGLRMISEGRFNDFSKLRKHMGLTVAHEQSISHIVKQVGESHGVPVEGMLASSKAEKDKLEKLWKSPDPPVLSNITSHLSHGKPAEKPIAGLPSVGKRIATGAATGLLDPAAGLVNAGKLSILSDAVKNNKYGKKLLDFAEKTFVKKPAASGWEHPSDNGFSTGLKNKAYEYLVNPTSATIKNTSSSIHEALRRN